MSGNLFPGGALFYGFTSCRCESVGRIIGIIDGGCGGFIGFAHRDGGSGMSGCDFCLPFLFGRSLAGLEGKGGVCFSGGGNARRPVLLEERFGLSEETVEELDGMTSARIAKLLRERGQAE